MISILTRDTPSSLFYSPQPSLTYLTARKDLGVTTNTGSPNCATCTHKADKLRPVYWPSSPISGTTFSPSPPRLLFLSRMQYSHDRPAIVLTQPSSHPVRQHSLVQCSPLPPTIPPSYANTGTVPDHLDFADSSIVLCLMPDPRGTLSEALTIPPVSGAVTAMFSVLPIMR
jgi:hypothetical protein